MGDRLLYTSDIRLTGIIEGRDECSMRLDTIIFGVQAQENSTRKLDRRGFGQWNTDILVKGERTGLPISDIFEKGIQPDRTAKV